MDVRADVPWNSGLAGLTARYLDEQNFVFCWYDGGSLVLARVESGNFIFMGAVSYTWLPGATRAMRLMVSSGGTGLFVDGVPWMSSPYVGVAGQTKAGLFNRNSSSNLWDNFSARPVQ